MNMRIAEQFECLIPSPNALKEGVLYCSTNATNAVDIWIAVGTVGATLAAVTFGIVEVVRGRSERKRQAKAEQQAVLNQQYQSLAQLIRQISWEFPYGNLNLISLLQSQIAVYDQLLKQDEDLDPKISENVLNICRRFAAISWTHSDGVHPASGLFDEGWDRHVASYGSLLGRIQFVFETTLTPWHQTRNSDDGIIKTLQDLVDEINETYEYFVSLDQYQNGNEQSPRPDGASQSDGV